MDEGGSKTERLLFALPCIFLLTFYFICVIVINMNNEGQAYHGKLTIY